MSDLDWPTLPKTPKKISFKKSKLIMLYLISAIAKCKPRASSLQWPYFVRQSYEIKYPPWTILWFRILGIFSVENIKRSCVFMFQTWDNSQLLRRVLWINAQLTIVWSLKHKISQPIYIFNRENSQNSESPNGPRRGLDFIALGATTSSLVHLTVYSINFGIFLLVFFGTPFYIYCLLR